jgi:hypothetical protein
MRNAMSIYFGNYLHEHVEHTVTMHPYRATVRTAFQVSLPDVVLVRSPTSVPSD